MQKGFHPSAILPLGNTAALYYTELAIGTTSVANVTMEMDNRIGVMIETIDYSFPLLLSILSHQWEVRRERSGFHCLMIHSCLIFN